MILVANLVYFHPLFTELKNFVPLTQNWRFCRGGRGLQRAHFWPFWAIWWLNGDKSAKMCTSKGFKQLIMFIEVCQRVINREFCQSCFLTGLQEPVVLRRTFWALTKNRHSKWEVKLTKSLFFYHYGGSKWHINYSYACSNWCVRVIYASFDPPLEIVSVREIFIKTYP